MGIFTITLPDIGEGIAEAELTEWNVAIGDEVQDEDVLGTVMTDQAAVEIPSTVAGKVVWLCGEPGDVIAIGAKFIQIEVEGEGNDAAAAEAAIADAVRDGPRGGDSRSGKAAGSSSSAAKQRRRPPRT